MPSNYIKFIQPIAIIAVAILIALSLYLSRSQPQQLEITSKPLLVNAIKVVKEDKRINVHAQGVISPSTHTILIAEVAGKIVDVSPSFKAGGFFKQGDMLLKIDQRDYLANLKRSEAAVASARSKLATEQGLADVAYQDWKKYKSGVKRSLTATNLALRKPQLEDAKANLSAATADLDHAKDQLDRTTILAPYDGLMRSQLVGYGQFVNVGSHIGETFAIDTAELRLPLAENKLSYLQLPTATDSDNNIETPVTLFAKIGDSTQQWQGKIVRTEGVFDERSRVLFAVAEIDDPYALTSPGRSALRIGTFVNARIEGRLIPNIIALPRNLLRAGNQLWVIDREQRLQNRQVTILRTEGSEVYITNGLYEDELVCQSIITGVAAGTKVRIAETILSSQSTLPVKQPTEDNNILELAPAPQLTADPTPTLQSGKDPSAEGHSA